MSRAMDETARRLAARGPTVERHVLGRARTREQKVREFGTMYGASADNLTPEQKADVRLYFQGILRAQEEALARRAVQHVVDSGLGVPRTGVALVFASGDILLWGTDGSVRVAGERMTW